MRHRKSGRQLNRNSSHRKAMFSNMAASLIESEVIKTSLRPKSTRRVVEPLITLAKEDLQGCNRRLAFSRTRSKAAVGKLFTEFGPAPDTKIVLAATPRFSRRGFRAGDAAPMAYIELVGRPVATEDLDEDYAIAQAVPAQEVAQETASETTETVEESVAAAEEESAAAAEEETATDAEEPKAEEDTTQEDKKRRTTNL